VRLAARLLPVLLALAAAWSMWAHGWGWLYALGVHPYPASSSTPWTYQLWSGFLPALTVVALLGSVAGWYRSANCKWERCPRIGHFRDSRGVKWCWKHHPDHKGQKPTGAFLHRLHHEHVARAAGR
jgi:hypothetical protein